MADETKNVSTYTKEQVLKSETYANYRDLFSVVLDENKSYTKKELEKAKNDFLNKPVVEQINE